MKRKITSLFLLGISLLALNSSVCAQVQTFDQQWDQQHTGGVNASLMPRGIRQSALDNQGNVYYGGDEIVGGVNKIKVIKRNSSGGTVWVQYYNNPFYTSATFTGLVSTNNGMYISGTLSSSAGSDGCVWKIDLNGNVLWDEVISLANNQSVRDIVNETMTQNALVLLTDFASPTSARVVKLAASSGTALMNYTHPGVIPYKLASYTNTVVFTATSDDPMGSGLNYNVVAITNTGSLIFDNVSSSQKDIVTPTGLAADVTGIYVAASLDNFGGYQGTLDVRKITYTGADSWLQNLDVDVSSIASPPSSIVDRSFETTYGPKLALDGFRQVVISCGVTVKFTQSGNDLFVGGLNVRKLERNSGASTWSAGGLVTTPGSGTAGGFLGDMKVDVNNNIVITGLLTQGGSRTMHVALFSSAGAQLFDRTYPISTLSHPSYMPLAIATKIVNSCAINPTTLTVDGLLQTANKIIYYVSAGSFCTQYALTSLCGPGPLPDVGLQAPSIYPNPASEVLTIGLEGDNNTPATVKIVDNYGVVRYTTQITEQTQLNLKALNIPAGLYSVIVERSGENKVTHLMVQ